MEDAEGEGKAPEEGFEYKGREEEAVCLVAAVDADEIGLGRARVELDVLWTLICADGSWIVV